MSGGVRNGSVVGRGGMVIVSDSGLRSQQYCSACLKAKGGNWTVRQDSLRTMKGSMQVTVPDSWESDESSDTWTVTKEGLVSLISLMRFEEEIMNFFTIIHIMQNFKKLVKEKKKKKKPFRL